MMEALSHWLREIIVIIMIATFVELLLPGQSMQRYVKVVISLFILMTILSPIIRFLRADFNLAKLYQETASAGADYAEMDHLQKVLDKGKKLSREQNEQALETVKMQVAQMMKNEVEATFSVRVQRVAVQVDAAKQEDPTLSSIEMELAAAKANRPSADNDPQIVKDIEPIHIEVSLPEVDPKSHSPSAEADPRIAGKPGEQESAITADIKGWLAKQWNVPESNVYIQFVQP